MLISGEAMYYVTPFNGPELNRHKVSVHWCVCVTYFGVIILVYGLHQK